jgi:hypothetical protein
MLVTGFRIGIMEEFCSYLVPVISTVTVAARKELILPSQSYYKTGVKYRF